MMLPLDQQEWQDREQQPITCTGKLRVLRENEDELRQVLHDACLDALLMDVGADYLKGRMGQLVAEVMATIEQASSASAEQDGAVRTVE